MSRKLVGLTVLLVIALTQVVPALANDQVRIEAGGDTSECEPESPNEWHWVINQVDPPSMCPEEIYVNWSDGEETVPLQKITGKTCHYVTDSHGWEPNVYLGAYAYIDPAWVEGNGQFVLSHRPCDEEEEPCKPSLKVCKYNDLNGNGNKDAGETLISWGYTLEINGQESHITSPDGDCKSIELDEGDVWSVIEDTKSGWESTTPTGVNGTAQCSEQVAIFGNKEQPPTPETECVDLQADMDLSKVEKGDTVNFTIIGENEDGYRAELNGSKLTEGSATFAYTFENYGKFSFQAYVLGPEGWVNGPQCAEVVNIKPEKPEPWLTSVGFGAFCLEAGGNWTPLDGAQHGAFITATLTGPSTVPVWEGPTGVTGFTSRYEARINTVDSMTASNDMGFPFLGYYEVAQLKDRPDNWLKNPGSAAWPVSFPQGLSAEGDYKTFVGLFDCRNGGDQEDDDEEVGKGLGRASGTSAEIVNVLTIQGYEGVPVIQLEDWNILPSNGMFGLSPDERIIEAHLDTPRGKPDVGSQIKAMEIGQLAGFGEETYIAIDRFQIPQRDTGNDLQQIAAGLSSGQRALVTCGGSWTGTAYSHLTVVILTPSS